MKYRVNLFPQELKPKLQLVTLNFVFFMWAVSIGIIWFLSQHYQDSYMEMENRTKASQMEYNNKKNLLETLEIARDNRAQDPKLLATVKKLQSEERAKYLLLSELQGREQLKNKGFSLLMKDLSQQHIPEIWLTRINVSERKIRIEGGAVESSKVPFWVDKLKNSEYFAGRDFAGARMFRNEEDELSFVISSELAELALEEAALPEVEVTQ